MKPYFTHIIFPLCLFSLSTSCNDQANTQVVNLDTNDDFFCESKYGPFEESEFSEWMDTAKYQIFFNAINFKDKAVVFHEGRNYKGLSQYRLVLKDRPDNFSSHLVRNFMDEQKFWQYGVNYNKRGYKRISLQVFKDASGTIRHQAVWFKFKSDEEQKKASE